MDPSGHNAFTKWVKNKWEGVKSFGSNIKEKACNIEDNVKHDIKGYAVTQRVQVEKHQEKYASQNYTISSDFSGSITIMACNFGVGISLVRDTKGNVGLQWNRSVGETLDCVGISVASGQTITDATNIHELTDDGWAIGGSGSVNVYGPLSAGIAYDHVSSPDGQINGHSLGGTLGISRGISVGSVSGEAHMSESNTQTIVCVNVYDLYYSLSDGQTVNCVYFSTIYFLYCVAFV